MKRKETRYFIANEPVLVLKKLTCVRRGWRKRFWLCRLPSGAERWVAYRELVRVTPPVKVNGERAKCNGDYD
jgi:hypothetical protein